MKKLNKVIKENKQLRTIYNKIMRFWYDVQNKYVRKGITEDDIFLLEHSLSSLQDALNRAKELNVKTK